MNRKLTSLLALITLSLVACCTSADRAAAPLQPDARIDALVARINDKPDVLHSDYTPAVHELIEIGERAFPRVLPLMESDDVKTRLRALRVLEVGTLKMYGFSPGHGWERVDGEQRWRVFWRSLGDLRHDASLSSRRRSVRLWREWIQSRKTATPLK